MQTIQFVGTTPVELAELITKSVKEELKAFNKITPSEKNPDLMTRKEVAKYLGLSVNTVYNYSKKGLLTMHQLRGTILYKRSEVDASLVELKK